MDPKRVAIIQTSTLLLCFISLCIYVTTINSGSSASVMTSARESVEHGASNLVLYRNESRASVGDSRLQPQLQHLRSAVALAFESWRYSSPSTTTPLDFSSRHILNKDDLTLGLGLKDSDGHWLRVNQVDRQLSAILLRTHSIASNADASSTSSSSSSSSSSSPSSHHKHHSHSFGSDNQPNYAACLAGLGSGYEAVLFLSALPRGASLHIWDECVPSPDTNASTCDAFAQFAKDYYPDVRVDFFRGKVREELTEVVRRRAAGREVEARSRAEGKSHKEALADAVAAAGELYTLPRCLVSAIETDAAIGELVLASLHSLARCPRGGSAAATQTPLLFVDRVGQQTSDPLLTSYAKLWTTGLKRGLVNPLTCAPCLTPPSPSSPSAPSHGVSLKDGAFDGCTHCIGEFICDDNGGAESTKASAAVASLDAFVDNPDEEDSQSPPPPPSPPSTAQSSTDDKSGVDKLREEEEAVAAVGAI